MQGVTIAVNKSVILSATATPGLEHVQFRQIFLL